MMIDTLNTGILAPTGHQLVSAFTVCLSLGIFVKLDTLTQDCRIVLFLCFCGVVVVDILPTSCVLHRRQDKRNSNDRDIDES